MGVEVQADAAVVIQRLSQLHWFVCYVPRMRALRFAATGLLITSVAAAEPAMAPPPSDSDRASETLKTFVDAIGKADDKRLAAALAPTVAIKGLELTTPACQKTFGTKRVKAAKRDALAKCLVSLATPPTWPSPMIHDKSPLFEAVIADECWTFEFQVRANKGAMQVSSFSAVKVCNEDTEQGGLVGGMMDAKLSPPPERPKNVRPAKPRVGGTLAGGGPIAATAPPPRVPTNVAPTLLEGSRIAGNKVIIPDDATKAAFAESGKAKMIASLKLCIDETGAVTTVSLLKSSGFAAYDKKLEREMRLWTYRPYLVNGAAVPVCTAVTFIYSQT